MTQAYTTVFQGIRNRILEGDFVPGQKLPPERELCEIFGVSRITIRHAMSLLHQHGMVERFAGKGTFVRSSDDDRRPIVDGDFITSLKNSVSEFFRKINFSKTEVPPKVVGEAFGLSQGQECFISQRIFMDGNDLISYDNVYIPLQYAQCITEDMLGEIDFLRIWLEKTGLMLSHFAVDTEARIAYPEQSQNLGIPEGAAILYSLDKAYGHDGNIIAVFESFYRGDHVKLLWTVKRIQGRNRITG